MSEGRMHSLKCQEERPVTVKMSECGKTQKGKECGKPRWTKLESSANWSASGAWKLLPMLLKTQIKQRISHTAKAYWEEQNCSHPTPKSWSTDKAGQLFCFLNGAEDPKLTDTHVHEAEPLSPHCPAGSSLSKPVTREQHRTSQLEPGQGAEQALCTTSTSNNMPSSFTAPLRSAFSILPNETRHGAGEKEAILWLLTAKIRTRTVIWRTRMPPITEG